MTVGTADAAVPLPRPGPALRFPEPQLAHNPRELKRRRSLPNTALLDHRGRTVRFYDDLVRDQRVVINVMYTSCQNICAPGTRNIAAARELLGPAAAGLRFISLTLTPVADDPQTLRHYMAAHRIQDNWTMLTGVPDQVEALHRALGFLPAQGQGTGLQDHAAAILLGDEAAVKWGHSSSLQSPASIARMIRFELL